MKCKMSNKMNWITKSTLMILAVSAVGCGQGFKSGQSSSSLSAQAINIDKQLERADKASQDAELAMTLAQSAIGKILDSRGNVNVQLFMKGLGSGLQIGGTSGPIVAQLQPLFDEVFNRVEDVKGKYDAARLALADALSKLDANDPAQAALLEKVKAQLKMVDAMEVKFRKSVHLLAGKLTLAVGSLDKVVSGATSFIPGFGWLASLAIDYLIMDDVKTLILDLQAKLLAL